MNRQSAPPKKNFTIELVITAFLTALVFVTTYTIKIQTYNLINAGLIHFGTVPLIIAAIVFDKKKGAFAGAFGMGLFDLLSGYTIWAPFTFVIRGIMGYLIGSIAEHKQGKSVLLNGIAITAGGIWLIAGYYLAGIVITLITLGRFSPAIFVEPLSGIPGDAVQAVSSLIICLPLIGVFKDLAGKYYKA